MCHNTHLIAVTELVWIAFTPAIHIQIMRPVTAVGSGTGCPIQNDRYNPCHLEVTLQNKNSQNARNILI